MVAPILQTARGDFDPFADDQTRLARYREAADFADGRQWLGRPRRGETRLVYNYARALITKVASYAFPGPLTYQVPPAVGAEQSAKAAEETLNELAADLDLDALDLALCIELSTLGDAAVKITWDVATNQPRVIAVHPSQLAVWWSPDNPTRALRVIHDYQLPGYAIAPAFGLAAAQVEGVQPAALIPCREDWTATSWSATVAGQRVAGGPNPYGWIPYLVLANERPPHSFWGRSDLEDLYDPARELNRELSILKTIMELSGAPIAVLEGVDDSTGVTVGPGAKWELPPESKAYLLDLLAGQGVSLHVDYVQQLRTTLHDLSETPRTAFGDSGSSGLSGVALEVEIQPLVQRVRRKRGVFNVYHRERNARLLDLLERFGGQAFGGVRRTRTIWPEILPNDREVEVRNEVSLVSANIHSRRTAAANLGTEDPEAEMQLVVEDLTQLSAAMPQDEESTDHARQADQSQVDPTERAEETEG